MTPDVNVLVAAFRADHPHHRAGRAWLDAAVAACATGARLTLMPMVAASFLRLVTSPKIFVEPAPIALALRFIDALLAAPGVQLATLGSEWPVLRKLCIDKQASGNDLPDVWLAAAVRHHGETLATFDRDFKKLLEAADLQLLTAA